MSKEVDIGGISYSFGCSYNYFVNSCKYSNSVEPKKEKYLHAKKSTEPEDVENLSKHT